MAEDWTLRRKKEIAKKQQRREGKKEEIQPTDKNPLLIGSKGKPERGARSRPVRRDEGLLEGKGMKRKRKKKNNHRLVGKSRPAGGGGHVPGKNW